MAVLAAARVAGASMREAMELANIAAGNDTGPSHMARLAGAKTVMLFNAHTAEAAAEMPTVVNLKGRVITDISVESAVGALEGLMVR